MDPITAWLLAAALSAIAVRFMGNGVGEAAAAIKGRPSPAAQKWEARQKAKQARGERSEQHKPGLLRVLWDNAIEEATQKAAARHVGRMEALREMAGTEQAKAREKLLRKAQRRSAVAERIAGLGNQSWGHARRLAGDTAAVINERRAERAASRDDTDAVDLEAPGTEHLEEAAGGEDEAHEPAEAESEGEDATVIPFRRPSAQQVWEESVAAQRAKDDQRAAAAGTNTKPTAQMYSQWRQAQGRQSPTQDQLRQRFGVATAEDVQATQVRGQFRVIPEWRDINIDWQAWHQGVITTQELTNTLLRDSKIDPALAAELQLTPADLSPYAAHGLAGRVDGVAYTPPSEAELREKFGHRIKQAGAEPAPAKQEGTTVADRDDQAHEASSAQDELDKIWSSPEWDNIRKRVTTEMSGDELLEVAGIDRELALELHIPRGVVENRAIWALWMEHQGVGEDYVAPTEEELREKYGRTIPTMPAAPVEQVRSEFGPGEILSPYEAAVQATQVRGQYRVVHGWGDANRIWKRWHDGDITAAERDAELAETARIDPALATELGMTAADLSPHAATALHARWKGWGYAPPSEEELRRVFGTAEENGPGDPEPEDSDSTVDGGNPDMTSATAENTTVPEIVDLATGIDYTTKIGNHFTGLGAKLAEDAAVVGNNAGAFDEHVGVIEAGQAALAAQGFGGVIQSSFDEVAEKLPSAADKLRQIEQLLSEVGEEITAAAGAMNNAKTALEDQRGLAEQVQAQSSGNGVANNTAFYQEA